MQNMSQLQCKTFSKISCNSLLTSYRVPSLHSTSTRMLIRIWIHQIFENPGSGYGRETASTKKYKSIFLIKKIE